jgi:hypothetical protein
VDIVFSDIEMPGVVDGFGLAKWIREHRPGLDILLAGTVPRAVENANNCASRVLCPNPTTPSSFMTTSSACWRPGKLGKKSKDGRRTWKSAERGMG